MTSATAGERGTVSTAIYIFVIVAALMAFLSFGVRASLGIFLVPVVNAHGWDRETFSLAIALQNLVWGATQPLAGMIADSKGYIRVLVGGVLLYISGLSVMAMADSAWQLYLGLGVLTGLGLAGASWTMSVAAAVRMVPVERQGWATGIAVAACSVGQLTIATLGQGFIAAFGWYATIWIMAGLITLIIPCAMLLARGANLQPSNAVSRRSSLKETLHAVATSRHFWMVFSGFMICGFHAGFIFTHLPAYVASLGMAPEIGALGLAAIGLTNLFSSYMAGVLGQTRSKRTLLIWIYAMRTLSLLAIFLLPFNEWILLGMAAILGVFWMSSIPPTSGLMGRMFGSYYIATLLGIVFFGHQVGSFIGAWLGGVIYDRMGSYDAMWWICAALSAVAAVINMPVDERPVSELAKSAST